MKKYLVGFLVGVLLTFTSTAFADDISRIGKKIEAEFVVKLDGNELPVKAIALEGTSYAPVRAIGEALGLDVDFQNKEVLLTTTKGEGDMTIQKIVEEIRLKEHDKGIYERAIQNAQGSLESMMLNYERDPNFATKGIEASKRQIEEYQEKLDEVERELADLYERLKQIEQKEAAE